MRSSKDPKRKIAAPNKHKIEKAQNETKSSTPSAMAPPCKFKQLGLLSFLLGSTMFPFVSGAKDVGFSGAKKIKVKQNNGQGKKLDISELGPPGQTFEGVDSLDMEFEVNGPFKTFDKVPGSGSSHSHWMGESAEGSTMTLVRSRGQKGNNDVLVGSIVDSVEHVVHQIRRDANGETIMVSTPSVDFPPEKEGHFTETRQLTTMHTAKSNEKGSRAATETERKLTSHPIIRVLVVWTQAAECAQSSLPIGCTVTAVTSANMEALAELAVQETNTAYSLSGVNAELQLAFAYRDPGNYGEINTELVDGNDAFDNALRDLRDQSDSNLNDVHSKRIEYGADAVVLLIDDPDWCGLGYEITTPVSDRMFSVTRWSCATGYYSFGHELAHNMVRFLSTHRCTIFIRLTHCLVFFSLGMST
jgi:hypothetical protein